MTPPKADCFKNERRDDFDISGTPKQTMGGEAANTCLDCFTRQ
jgi:hypothetical protein